MQPRSTITCSWWFWSVMGTTKFSCFSTFKLDWQVKFQNFQGKDIRCHSHSLVTNKILVPTDDTCLVNFHIKIASVKTTLYLPTDKAKIYPLFVKLQMIAVFLSGKPSDQHSFQKKLDTSSSILGKIARKADMKGSFRSGHCFVKNIKQVSLLHMWTLHCYFCMVCIKEFLWIVVFVRY